MKVTYPDYAEKLDKKVKESFKVFPSRNESLIEKLSEEI